MSNKVEATFHGAELDPCPECVQSKHGNCDGSTWNVATDDQDVCPCSAAGHDS